MKSQYWVLKNEDGKITAIINGLDKSKIKQAIEEEYECAITHMSEFEEFEYGFLLEFTITIKVDGQETYSEKFELCNAFMY